MLRDLQTTTPPAPPAAAPGRTIRRLRRRLRGFRLRSEGFIGRTARAWMRSADADARPFSEAERARAQAWGFTPQLVENFGITERNRHEFLPLRDYLYAQPFNGTYAKWVRSLESAERVFAPFSALFDGGADAGEEPAPPVTVIVMNPAGGPPRIAEATVQLGTAQPGAEGAYTAAVDRTSGVYRGARCLVEGRLVEHDRDPVTGELFEGRLAGWEGLGEVLGQLCAFAPQLRFFALTLRLASTGIRILDVRADPPYSQLYPFPPETVAFLRELVAQRRAGRVTRRGTLRRGARIVRLKLRREFARAFFPRGLLPYQSTRWLGDVRRDLFQRGGASLSTKLWAYRHGFLSYRIAQYGITPANREQFISDFEYRWLRHINGWHSTWLEDKVSLKYVAAEFDAHLPDYYFTIAGGEGRTAVVPLMDCPAGFAPELSEVLRLARERGVLALKPEEGSHGEGFYRLSATDEGYFLNGVPATQERILALLTASESRYLVTEFIRMHPVLAALYPHAVNTIRLIVFTPAGGTPQIGNAYLRIGTSASGAVDNTAAGGMLAEIDRKTGRFGNAQRLRRGRVQACPRHPDTGVLIEGTIPHWELITERIVQIAERLAPLEYLGFDVAVTEEGFILPEINRFPDYPRIDRLTPETAAYLLHKLAEKKRLYGYDRHRPRTLVSLPRRAAS